MTLKNQLTKTPYLVLFIVLISVGVGTASALATYTFTGNVIVDGTLTADEYFDNKNSQTGDNATAIGGNNNLAGGFLSTVGGGGSNTASGAWSTIGGGETNIAGVSSTVSGGTGNNASALRSTVGGGFDNNANQTHTTIAGGSSNIASNFWATVGGGDDNTASGQYSTVPGGEDNQADGDYSFAAGRNAHAIHDGSFVFSDSGFSSFASTAPDQFSINAANGLRLIGPFDCQDCVNGTAVADGSLTIDDFASNSITGDQINGTSKLLFRECSASFTSVAAGTSDVASCSIAGLAQDDNAIIADNTQIPNCFIFNGLSTSLGNSGLLQISMYNFCGTSQSSTINFSVIIFRVN